MNLAEINKGAVALLMVLLLGAGGYLWYSMLYKPADAARLQAKQAASAAETSLSAAQQELAAAQARVEESKKDSARLDDSVARLAKARTAIPTKKLIDDAAIVLVELAQRSGVQTAFKAGGEGTDASATGESGLQGAVPVDLEFEAAGTYAEMMQFMSLVEDTVEAKNGKLYTRGRLFNVVKLQIGAPEEDAQQADGFGEEQSQVSQLLPGPNDILFTVVVRMYTSSVENSDMVGANTPDDPAAAGLDGAPTGADAGTGAGAPAATDGGTGAAGEPDAQGTTAPAADPAVTAGAGAATGGDI